MFPSILITQCLQNDFVKPMGRRDRLPNLLHVGFEEARRLMGEEPAEGPVARLMGWAYGRTDDELRVLHIRDWHDPEDPNQEAHLRRFGNHCLQGTEGAAFAFDFEAGPEKDVPIVDTVTLNDFLGTQLESILEAYRGRPTRVGLVGVWTEAKITFLAYEIRSRFPRFQIGVCSALTAGASRQNHFIALEQLEKILGAHVFSSLGEFVEFLGGKSDDVPLTGFTDEHPHIEVVNGARLMAVDQKLLRFLFRDCREARLRALGGGFSGNVVLGSESTDLNGHEQVPHVVKIGPRHLIGRERTAFERIEAVLGNSAPRISDFADFGDRGAIKYRYAAMGRGFSTTFQKQYVTGAPMPRIESILTTVFSEQLGRLYKAARRERCDLLDYYGFERRWAAPVREKVEALLGTPAEGETLELPSHRSIPNICRFYERDLDQRQNIGTDTAYFSFVHGDLNGANIIIDQPGNVWLIDFFHTHRGHVLRDLIKLENDLLYIFTPLAGLDDLERAFRLTELLASVDDLASPLPDAETAGISGSELWRAWETLRHLRSFYPDLIQADGDPFPFFVGQMRYAVHTLGFDESNRWQKLWALYTAGLACEQIRVRRRF